MDNRYARDWNTYSDRWQEHYGERFNHLGDEWCDDGTEERASEVRWFTHSVQPWLRPESRVVEIGPGGGKWSVRIAPKVRSLTVFDVAENMLERTATRCKAAGLDNVSVVHGDGKAMSAIPSGSVDLVFSYDVFVHIALEDTVAYVQEFARILRDGGMAIVHHAIADVAPAWDRIESHNDWYRRGNTLGQYYYYSREALEQMYHRAGLRVVATSTSYCTVVLTVVKPQDNLAPWIEQVLREAAVADTPAKLEDVSASLEAIGREMRDRLAGLRKHLESTKPGAARFDAIQKLRRLLRG